jgi:hypothetical protein
MQQRTQLLSPEQVAYCPQQSRVDHLSTLVGLIERRTSEGKNTYVCFTDLKQLFNGTCRCNCFTRMRKVGFRGKAAQIIYNIFSDTRNTVRFDRATY